MDCAQVKKKYSPNVKNLFIFFIGFTTYISIEVIWRGHSHWSMGILGGLCFFLIGQINKICPRDYNLIFQCLLATAIVTALELVAGLILNVWLGLNIWDYSYMRFNFMGQISLQYSLLWIPLSLFAIFFDDWLRHFLFCEPKPKYKIGKWTYEFK